jgi:hypothetical protein
MHSHYETEALIQTFNAFNQFIAAGLAHLRESPYPYDAFPQLSKGRKGLEEHLGDDQGSRKSWRRNWLLLGSWTKKLAALCVKDKFGSCGRGQSSNCPCEVFSCLHAV